MLAITAHWEHHVLTPRVILRVALVPQDITAQRGPVSQRIAPQGTSAMLQGTQTSLSVGHVLKVTYPKYCHSVVTLFIWELIS